MIKVKDNNISLSGSRMELTKDMMAIMVAYIQIDPVCPEAAAGLLCDCLTRAVDIVKSPYLEMRKLDKNIIKHAFEEMINEQEAEQ